MDEQANIQVVEGMFSALGRGDIAGVTWRVAEHSGVSLGKGILVWRREKSGPPLIWRGISMYD